jgi:hypothetical protein
LVAFQAALFLFGQAEQGGVDLLDLGDVGDWAIGGQR